MIKRIPLDIIMIALIGLILSYSLVLSGYEAFIYLAAGLFSSALLHYIPDKNAVLKTILSIIIPIGVIIIGKNELQLCLIFLAGINFSTLYFQLKFFEEKFLNSHFINIILISNLIFIEALSKFRGFNKLQVQDIYFSILILVGLNFLVFLLSSGLYKITLNHFKKRSEETVKALKTFFPLMILISAYLFLSQTYFKEIGTELILFPLICGVIAATSSLLLKPNSLLNNIVDILLLVIMPFRIGGFLGVILAMLTSILFLDLSKRLIFKEDFSARETIYKYFPLSFIFALTEIRENQGLITRFNIVSGYQLGWIIIGIIISVYSYHYLERIKKFVTENEVLQFFALSGTVFTISVFAIIINLGRDEGIISLTLSSVIYLVLLSVLDYEKYKKEIRIANSVAACIGILSFLILTKI
jgi:hypothetical protein